MTIVLVVLVLVALIVKGLSAISDARPQERPPEWTVGGLMTPTRRS